MADDTVESFLKGRKKRKNSRVSSAASIAPSNPTPLLQMNKYKVPKKMNDTSDSTNSQENRPNSAGGAGKIKVEIEVENYDVLYTKHMT